ncbi:hypothetical protein FUA48_15915 [Flavobacterium alkalisoli]|uniref:Uncharacterized protein n=1 Tax=Flavobacterium alkalisoli TaxID=2602769 RepID=A0A5B9FYZ9_9FLAO|nr:hypothetical protein [Flavobacterium alkalisoli]QEE51008.1 hypothetical protein FUA48_15915 [Flavobacterium alkalisoli]
MGLEIFKTNIETEEQAQYLAKVLQHVISDGMIRFELENASHIFSIETNREIEGVALSVFIKQGISCQKL